MGKAKQIDITGQRFGKLVAVKPTEKRNGTNVVWQFICDCGNTIERDRKHLSNTSSCGCEKWKSLQKDISGQKFGMLTALEPTGQRQGKTIVWKFQCDCGNIIFRPKNNVTGGNTSSCGCLKKANAKYNNPNYESLIGNRYGMLTVISKDESISHREIQWKCKCDCGMEVIASTHSLKTGIVRSCGCTSNRLYAVYKHVSPENKVYIGITSAELGVRWYPSRKLQNQHAFFEAIQKYGGLKEFHHSFKHYILQIDDSWVETDGKLSFEESHFFTKEDAYRKKKEYIEFYRSTDPAFGYNSASGEMKGYTYNEKTKELTSATKTGADNRKDWLVYIHTNKINGKKYIGRTSRDPILRWQYGVGYKRPRTQTKSLSHFYNAIEKYGWDNFEHEIVKRGLTAHESAELEKQLIRQFNTTDPNVGYNITKGGDGAIGTHHTQETKDLISRKLKAYVQSEGAKSFKGKHHSEETKEVLRKKALERINERGVPFKGQHHSEETKKVLSEKKKLCITKYDLTGLKIETYPSVKDAAMSCGTTSSAISACANGRTKFCGGFIWRFLDVEQLPSSEMPQKVHHNSKRIHQIRLDGERVATFDSLRIAAESIGVNSSSISAAVANHSLCDGFFWEYDKPTESGTRTRKAIQQYSLDGVFLEEYVSIRDASKVTGISEKNISAAARGTNDTAGGFIWKYK